MAFRGASVARPPPLSACRCGRARQRRRCRHWKLPQHLDASTALPPNLAQSVEAIPALCTLARHVSVCDIFLDCGTRPHPWVAVAATARCHESKHITLADLPAGNFGGQLFNRPVRSLQLGEANGSGLTTIEAVGPGLEAIEIAGKRTGRCVNTELSGQATTAAMLPRAAGNPERDYRP